MKIAYLNTYNNGSTGRIIDSLKEICQEHNIETISIYARGVDSNKKNSYKHQSKFEFYLDGLCTRLFDAHGLGNFISTLRIIRRLKTFKPDIVHLHNLHGYWINYVLLFQYLKKNDIKVVWTFHDCWHFTGHCTHFDYVKCERWKNGCHHCIQTKEFPSSLFDFSKRNYRLKKKSFTSVKDILIVTPSHWLKDKVKESFLKGYEVEVIHNGIDLEKFKPMPNSEFGKEIKNKGYQAIILGVAATWTERKGLKYIQEVAKRRKDWYFVIIGSVMTNQSEPMENMLYIERTENINILCEWYSTSYILVMPTLEDSYPTTNLESIACGTPVVTFPTGGSEEIVTESGYGCVTCERTSDSLLLGIEEVLNNKDINKKPGFELDSRKNFLLYIDIYKQISERQTSL